jgi:hypothetical protein
MVLFERNVRILDEPVGIGMESIQEALDLPAYLLVSRQSALSQSNGTRLKVHFQHTLLQYGRLQHPSPGTTLPPECRTPA